MIHGRICIMLFVALLGAMTVMAAVNTTTLIFEPSYDAVSSLQDFVVAASSAVILQIPVPIGSYNLSMVLNMVNSYVSAGECTNVQIGVQRVCTRWPDPSGQCVPTSPIPEVWQQESARAGYATMYNFALGSTRAIITNAANQLGTTPKKIYEKAGYYGYSSSSNGYAWQPQCDCYTAAAGSGIAISSRYEIMVYNNASKTCHMNFASYMTAGDCTFPISCPGTCTIVPFADGLLTKTLAMPAAAAVIASYNYNLPSIISVLTNQTRVSYTCDCNVAQEGYDCSVPLSLVTAGEARTDVPELVNQEQVVYSQRVGQPIRFKVWLSRTNTLARVTISHGNGTRVANSTFNQYVTRTIVRARLGPNPPAEPIMTYIQSRANPYFSSYTTPYESTGYNLAYDVTGYGIQYDTTDAYPTFTLTSSDQTLVLEFGADSVQQAANLSLSKNIPLYVEVMIEGTQQLTNQYPFNFQVTITIDDSIGNMVGLVGICILAGVLCIAGCYLCYRARKSKDSLCTVLKGAIMSRPTMEKHVHKPKRRHRKRSRPAHARNGSGTGLDSDGGKGVYSAKGLTSGGSPIQVPGARLSGGSTGTPHAFDSNSNGGTPARVSTPPHASSSSHAITVNSTAMIAASTTPIAATTPVIVSSAVHAGLTAPLPPPGLPISPNSWNRQGTEQGEEEEDESCCFKTCGIATRTIVGIIGLALALFLAVLTSVFNVSLLRASLSTSIGSWVSFPDVEALKADIKSSMSFLRVTWFSDFYQYVERYLGWLDFVESIGLSWNCGGALSVYTPIVLFFGALFLVALLQKDLLMVIGIAMKGKDDNRSWLFNQVREKGAAGLTMLILMFLQTAVVQFSSIMFSVWGIQRSCSSFDHDVVTVGRTLSIAFIMGFFYLAIMAFANVRDFSCRGLTFGWVRGIIDLVIISLGYWNPRLLATFEIKTRAKAFDTQDDGNSQQQDVMTLLAKSRSLLWVAVPSGVLLTQWCAAANSPPLLIANYRKAALALWFPYYKRLIMWFTSMSRFVLQVAFVFYGGETYFLASVAFAALHVFWDVALPNDCGCCRSQQPRRQVHPMPGTGMLISVSSKKV